MVDDVETIGLVESSSGLGEEAVSADANVDAHPVANLVADASLDLSGDLLQRTVGHGAAVSEVDDELIDAQRHQVVGVAVEQGVELGVDVEVLLRVRHQEDHLGADASSVSD